MAGRIKIIIEENTFLVDIEGNVKEMIWNFSQIFIRHPELMPVMDAATKFAIHKLKEQEQEETQTQNPQTNE